MYLSAQSHIYHLRHLCQAGKAALPPPQNKVPLGCAGPVTSTLPLQIASRVLPTGQVDLKHCLQSSIELPKV
jgi:hypothetical protein